MKWNIIADTSVDKLNFNLEGADIKFSTVPFTILIDGVTYIDNEKLNREDLLKAMSTGKDLKTACASPALYEELYEEDAYNIVFTISANLSGSFNSATSAKEMFLEEHKDAKVTIINSLTAGAEVAMGVDYAIEQIKAGKTYEEVVELTNEYLSARQTVFALCSFDNLVRNGRMSKLTYAVARVLHMWGIGVASKQGTIEVVGKTRGKKVVLDVVDVLKNTNFNGKKLYVSHCDNEEIVNLLTKKVKEAYPDCYIEVFDTRGVCSFYAEHQGFIVGY